MSKRNDVPADTLRDFILWHVRKGTDYATAFALACNPYGSLCGFEQTFDKFWDRYYEMHKLQN